jgi:protein TonB
MFKENKRIGILKLKYRKVLEGSLMLSIIIVLFLFYSFKTFEHENKLPNIVIDDFEVFDIPQTHHNKPKPPPSRPPFPVEAEPDELVPDITIEVINEGLLASLGDPPPPPQLKEPDVYEFVKVQEKPVLLKYSQPHYPEIARKADIEGTVIVKVLISKKGNVEKAEIYKSIPVLDDAALEASMKCKFKPAKQRDKFVKVWMKIPFKFKLK